MEAKDSLVIIIRSLIEIAQPISRQTLIDFLTGKETREMEESHLDDLETFASGDTHDEEYWTTVIDAACEAGYTRVRSVKSDTLVATPAGRKFARRPTSFPVSEDDEPVDAIGSGCRLDELPDIAPGDKAQPALPASPKTKQQIKLIKAVDLKVALDDFAESESLALDEVLDELDTLTAQGRALDITYFTDEVLGKECMDELLAYFRRSKTDDVDKAAAALGEAYNEEEIRLARIVYRNQRTRQLTRNTTTQWRS